MKPLACSFTFAVGAVLGASGATMGPGPRPNVLWLVSEDNSAQFVGAYGDPLARTPHLDRLAADGIVFTRVYSSAPVCAPARSTIITGVNASSLGTEHMRSAQPLPAKVKFFPELLRAAGYRCTNNTKTDYNTSTSWAGAWDVNGPSGHWRGRAPGQPFFAVFNFEQSHEGRQHKLLPLITDPAAVRVPAYLPDTPVVRTDLAHYYDAVGRADAAIGRVLAQLAADGLADDTIVIYYGDNGGVHPRSKRFLYHDGTHVPMIAYFPPRFRHLAPAATDGRCAELVTFDDLAPTMLALAGVDRPSYLQGRAFAGPEREPAKPYAFTFRGRMDERTDFSRAVTSDRFHYIRNYRPRLPHGRRIEYLWQQASMREWASRHAAGTLDPVQRAFFEPKPAEELFDIAADPDNVRNLAGDPGHREILLRMRRANRDHLLATRDTGFLPEALMVELAAGNSPTVVTATDDVYPLARLIGLVDAGQLDDGGKGELTTEPLDRAARDPLAVVRYWAVELSGSRPDGTDIRARALEDPNSSVRLAAAGAQLDADAGNAGAWAVIADALAPDRSTALRLAAAEIATGHRAIPPAVLAALRASAPANAGKAARELGPVPVYISRLVRSWDSATAAVVR